MMDKPSVTGKAGMAIHNSLAAMLANVNTKKRFEEMLGKNAGGFISSILSLTNATPALQKADPKTILTAAGTAAALKLPINPNLGFAYIIPYNVKVETEENGKKIKKWVTQAQFQMGFKGYIQLAMRTGQYKTLNVKEVYEGQIKNVDWLTGEIERGEKISDKIIGYVAFFKLINGFEKQLYMTKKELEAHGRKYSKAYSNMWEKNFDAMAKKTVLKLLISKFGIMSIDMQGGMDKALQADQAVINSDGTYNYIDNKTREDNEIVIDGEVVVDNEVEPAEERTVIDDDEILEKALEAGNKEVIKC